MPYANVTGGRVYYELFGEGPLLVWNSGGWSGIDNIAHQFAGRFADGRTVLIWEHFNTGRSAISIDNQESEFHQWVQNLYDLLLELDMFPVDLAGESNGAVYSILFAYMYPDVVRSLILSSPPADDGELLGYLANDRYKAIADVAEKDGMDSVPVTLSNSARDIFYIEPVSDCFNNPENQNSLMSMDRTTFVKTMRKWDAWYRTNRTFAAHLTNEQVARIFHPCFVSQGFFNDLHPESSAIKLASELPNSELCIFADYCSADEFNRIKSWSEDEQFDRARVATFKFWQQFLAKAAPR